jgi:PIN domain nuclease of toxin-antitoxin system
MSPLRSAVADTNALLFHAAGGAKLGRRAAAHFDACERRQAITLVPAAVLWEAAILLRTGRWKQSVSPREFFDRLFSNPSYRSHPLTVDQIWTGADLRINRDPFDALICAAAMELELPLITRDTDIVASKAVRVLW